MNKTKKSVKTTINTIANGIDISLGGLSSKMKSNISSVYSGYLDEKINQLIIDILNNTIEENELNDFINNITDTEKDLLYVVIKKSLDSKDRIIIYILSRLLSQRIKNGCLGYFEETLLVNIDKFVESDFKNYVTLLDNMTKEGNNEFFTLLPNNDEEEISLVKFISIGIFKENKSLLFNEKQNYFLFKTNYSDELYSIIQSFYT